ncbi:phosphonate C-P lyase system protein PhnH [Stella sp.]|uniref:phosphonate C-P lyase system protein PhnH n=1 Tax=Stella sp. TaxID=2912054 RepID=UPI0035B4912E
MRPLPGPAPAPGFADPVADSQRTFRALLDAIARPGTVARVGAAVAAPAPLSPAAAASLLTLVDFETPLWLDPAARAPEVDTWLRFHCGAPLVPDAAQARFALVAGPATALLPLDRFPAGDDAYPDRSATLIVLVADLRPGSGWRLTGPGIEDEARLAVDGLPAGFAAAWAANRALFPRGIDLFLAAGDRVAALPRTVRIEE